MKKTPKNALIVPSFDELVFSAYQEPIFVKYVHFAAQSVAAPVPLKHISQMVAFLI
jgi:hypothetical protein